MNIMKAAAVMALVSTALVASVEYSVVSDWGSGYQGQFAITNTTAQAYKSVSLEFDLPYSITSIWDASIVSHAGKHYEITLPSWKTSLSPSERYAFGFIATPGNATVLPSNIKLNGVSVTPDTDINPVAEDDAVTTTENTPVVIYPLANDSDPNGATIFLSTFSQPSNGMAVQSGDSLTYTPSADYSGTDYFSYIIGNDKGGTSSANITVTIVPSSTSSDVYAAWDASKTYVAGDKVSYNGVNYEAKWWTLGENPANSGEWGVWKAIGQSGTPTVTKPVALAVTASTDQNQSVVIDVLGSATGTSLSIASVSTPSHGTAVIANAKVTYTPATGYSGADSFTYTVKDSSAQTASAAVNVTVIAASVPAAPVANDISVSTAQNESVAVDVLGSATGTSLSIASVSTPAHGTAVIANAKVTYTPATGYSGADSFTYTVKDSSAQTATATVNVTVSASATAPVAGDVTATTTQNESVVIDVLGGATGTGLSIASVSTPSHGTAVIANGKVTYTPTAGYNGADAFTYTVTDGNGQQASATVNVTVTGSSATNAPVANAVSVSVLKNNAVTVDVLANASAANGGLELDSITQPSQGLAVIADGKVVYTPNSEFTGQDSFSYTVKDSLGLTATALVNVLVSSPSTSLDKVNATYWCLWGGNTSYNIGGKQIVSSAVDLDKVDLSYNVLIVAFIITDSSGNLYLSYDMSNPANQQGYYTPAQVKQFITNAKAQGRKVIVSVGGEKFSLALKTTAQKELFVQQAKAIIDEYGFDGLDLDMEAGSFSSDPVLLGNAVTEIVNAYRAEGQTFYLTAAPEWCYIVPFAWGSGQWASHSLAGDFYKNLINTIGVANFSYIWPQLYNQGPANGITGKAGTKVTPTEGMDKFMAAMVWAATTTEGYAANGSLGLQIPGAKFALGIPATEGAAGGEMAYIATPALITSAVSLIAAQGTDFAGFMNWSVDWDALTITDGQLTAGYTHTPWETGRAVAAALSITLTPETGDTAPVVAFSGLTDGQVIEQSALAPITVAVSATSSNEIVTYALTVGGVTYTTSSVDWTPPAFGTYTISAVVTDSNGKSTTKTISVTVNENASSGTTAPVITFSGLTDGQVIEQSALAPITVAVSATSSNEIASYALTVGGVTYTSNSVSWTPSAFGTYTISATVADTQGLSTTQSITVTVQQGSVTPGTAKKQIIGYITQWDAWKGDAYQLPAKGVFNQLNVDYTKYTILNYSFFGVAKDGSLHSADFRNKAMTASNPSADQEPADLLNEDIYSSWDMWLLYGDVKYNWNTSPATVEKVEGGAPGLFTLCKQNNVKLMASIGGWSMSKHFSAMANSPTLKANFISGVKRLMALGFDGIDIDWEYPGAAGMNFTGNDYDYANYLSLMKDIRAAIGTDKILTGAFSAAPKNLDGFDWTELAKYMDYFNIMSYDLEGGWSDTAGDNSALYGASGALCWDNTFKYLTQTKGVDPAKINMGVAFYGRGVETSGAAALGAPTKKSVKSFGVDGSMSSAADFTNWGLFEGVPNYAYIVNNATGWTALWDDVGQVPYMTKGDYFLSYDNPASVGLKADYVNNNGAAGVIVWQVFGDMEFSGGVTYVNPTITKLPKAAKVTAPLLDVLSTKLSN